jgi:hypothetical protein
MTYTVKTAPLAGTPWPSCAATVSVAATGDASSLFSDAAAKVRAIPAASAADRMARDSVAADLTWLSGWPPSLRSAYPCALDELLSDAAAIQGIAGPTTDAHVAIDEIVRNYEARSAL